MEKIKEIIEFIQKAQTERVADFVEAEKYDVGFITLENGDKALLQVKWTRDREEIEEYKEIVNNED